MMGLFKKKIVTQSYDTEWCGIKKVDILFSRIS